MAEYQNVLVGIDGSKQSLLGALRSGIITHVVTNDAIAQRVLQNID